MQKYFGNTYYHSNLMNPSLLSQERVLHTDQDQEKELISESKNRMRLRSNINEQLNNEEDLLGTAMFQNEMIQGNGEVMSGSSSFKLRQQNVQQKYFNYSQNKSENKYSFGGPKEDDHKKGISQSEDHHQIALTPQITSSQSGKRQHSQQQRTYNKGIMIGQGTNGINLT
mmetsp:Transcript_33810/g.32881  ORF Transcript_33810/g.32881 Transcript_33810/m.32881 type:complete len:170 (-) Transcript_33810:655-1164(-)